MSRFGEDLLTLPAAAYLPAGIIVACRLGGLLLVAPFIPSGVQSLRLRLGVLAVLSFCVATSRPVLRVLTENQDVLSMLQRPGLDGWLLVFFEFLVGGVLGWVVLLVVGAVRGACGLMSQQIGLSTSAVVDPMRGSDDDVLSRFYTTLAILVLFLLDMHHTLVRTLVESYAWIPPGSADAASIPRLLLELTVHTGPDIMIAAVSLALPVLVAMLFISLAQGILGKMLPEAELLVLGLPVRVLVGLSTLAVSLPATTGFVRFLLKSAARDGREFLHAMSG